MAVKTTIYMAPHTVGSKKPWICFIPTTGAKLLLRNARRHIVGKYVLHPRMALTAPRRTTCSCSKRFCVLGRAVARLTRQLRVDTTEFYFSVAQWRDTTPDQQQQDADTLPDVHSLTFLHI